MAGHQYLSDSKNPFFSVEEDVDDDAFLRHPKQGSSGYMFPEQQPKRNPIEERRIQLQEERRKIEERTLDSSNRSVGLLQESERAGIETAEVSLSLTTSTWHCVLSSFLNSCGRFKANRSLNQNTLNTICVSPELAGFTVCSGGHCQEIYYA